MRPDEAHPHRRSHRNRQPTLAHLRDRRAQRQPLDVLAPECPRQPAGPTNHHLDRHPLTRHQLHPWRHAPTTYQKRDRAPVRSERPRTRKRPAERLHLHPGQCPRVSCQPRPRPRPHGRGQPEQHDRHHAHSPRQAPARAPRRTQTARQKGRGPRPNGHPLRIRGANHPIRITSRLDGRVHRTSNAREGDRICRKRGVPSWKMRVLSPPTGRP